jgi:hypothetical protein
MGVMRLPEHGAQFEWMEAPRPPLEADTPGSDGSDADE